MQFFSLLTCYAGQFYTSHTHQLISTTFSCDVWVIALSLIIHYQNSSHHKAALLDSIHSTCFTKMKSIAALFEFSWILLFCLITSSMKLSAADIPGIEADRISLLALKKGIIQDPLRAMTSWNTSNHFCKWEGVTCSNRHQRVIGLNLSSKGLMGSVSPYIGNLSFLRIINFQNNSFQDTIPHELGRLFRLRQLRMDNNSLSDKIPASLSNCSDLSVLILAHNNLQGNIPVEFGSLSKLAHLDFYVNNLTGSIPNSFANLSLLQILVLARNNLDGTIPNSFGHLRRLTFFSMGVNMLSGRVPPLLYNISSLMVISVPLNRLQGSLPRGADVNLPNLQGFHIGGNQLSGSIPVSFISNTSGLQTLDLGYNNFFGKVPIEVGMLKSLKYLQVDGNNLGNRNMEDLDFISSLNNCSNLAALSMSQNQFAGMLPSSIANLSNTVTELYLGGNQISGTIPSDISNLNNLIILPLEDNSMTGKIPESIGRLGKLQILSLRGNRFSAPIPSSMGNMSQLYYLDLSDNILEGNISSLENCQRLQIFNLSHNHLDGTIPKQLLLSLSERLTSIILANNSLTGPLPWEVGNLKNLQMLDISDNKVSGHLPSALSGCSSLEHLLLQGNFFEGIIPSSFSSLRILQSLDLSRNNLSGRIPKGLESLTFLRYVNLSFNGFQGEVPINGIFENVSAVSVVGNDELCGGIPDLDLSKCHVQTSKKQGMSLSLKLTLGLVIPLLSITSLLLVFWFSKNQRRNPSSEQFLSFQEVSEKSHVTVSYRDLSKATNGFSAENLVGAGSSGAVYKGVLNKDEQPIAVKVLNLIEPGAAKSFLTECEVLRKIRHRNLLKILTVCSSLDSEGNNFKALVFELMPNGSLERWLHPCSDGTDLSRNLNLAQRLNIAIDVASALDYLHNHCEMPIVHCDLKPSNILLDHDMVARVGDFGLAKFLPKTTNNLDRKEISSSALRGTIGYIPPEYGQGFQVSTQGDVYSYGMLMLEMFTGKRPTDETFKDGLSLRVFSKLALSGQVMNIIDAGVLFEGIPSKANNDFEDHINKVDRIQECLISIIKIGVACSSEAMVERQDISEVLMELHAIKEVYFGNGIQSKN